MTASTKSSNRTMRDAQNSKKNEFFTRLADIEKEMVHYKSEFNGKWVYSNCDDPRRSQFVRYFLLNFEHLGLAGYEASGLDANGIGWHLQYTGGVKADVLDQWIEDNAVEVEDGRYQSDASLEALARCDIVVTNPPFSLFGEYIETLVDSGKRFLIIGDQNAITYQNVWPMIQSNQLWWGVSSAGGWYVVPEGYRWKKMIDGEKCGYVSTTRWFTNIGNRRRSDGIPLFRSYNEADNPRYENYAAVNVDKTKDIPCDYDGVMGVPITFLSDYCPDQFEIVGITKSWDDSGLRTRRSMKGEGELVLPGRNVYVRILVKRV